VVLEHVQEPDVVGAADGSFRAVGAAGVLVAYLAM
jgi:hypothetical protein